MTRAKLFLICTGLGRVNRGFESYISDLAEHLTESRSEKYLVQVYAGAYLNAMRYNAVRIINISRNNPILLKLKFSIQRLFSIEQKSFFVFLVPHILFKRPKAIYLGEYNLYCYLFKLRKLLSLKYSLVLYTGGQASPGLFDMGKDYVHHVTDVYYADLLKRGIHEERQFIIPHFLNTNFEVRRNLVEQIRNRASGKKIVISVGMIDKSVKRMHLITAVLGSLVDSVFPILLGEWTNESEEIKQLMVERFGADGFIIGKTDRVELGSYYAVADAFILCSKKESFGLVFLEAMYFDTPVICHDFYESRYVLRDNAHFMDMDDIDSFKENINALIPKLKKESILNLFVRQNYTWQVLREPYNTMFDKVMEVNTTNSGITV